MTIDRKCTPAIRPVSSVSISTIQQTIMPNGIPLYFLSMGEEEVCRIDLIIGAGKWNQSKKLVSLFTNLMLKEGAGNRSSEFIAEQLDFYGAWLQLSETFHCSYLTLYTPNRYFYEVLNILEWMLKEPEFPEKEFRTILERRKQQYFIEKEKVQNLAISEFTNMLFGDQHPYGSILSDSDFDQVEVADLKDFYQNFYSSANTTIVLSGKISDSMLQLVEKIFGQDSWGSNNNYIAKNYPVIPSEEKKKWVVKEGALQNSVRIGLPVINRMHPDFHGLRLVNTLFGGYFSSRLMSNIREEKGYTYGISSGIANLKNASYWSVHTETAVEYTNAVIREVEYEIDRLHQELVGEEELDRVRNYMLGDFARSLDNVFSIADIYISLLSGGLPFDYYEKQTAVILGITAADIQNLARKYLIKDSFHYALAGTPV